MGIFAKSGFIRKQAALIGGDLILSIMVINMIRISGDQMSAGGPGSLAGNLMIISSFLFSSYFCEIYSGVALKNDFSLIRTFTALSLSLFITLILKTVFGYSWLVFPGVILFFILQSAWQKIYARIILAPIFLKKVIVVGTGKKALKIEKMIKNAPEKFDLSGFVSTEADPVDVEPVKIVGKIDDIDKICRALKIHAVILALTERRGNLKVDRLISCKLMGVRIFDYPSFYESITGKLPVESLNPSWLVESSGFLITPFIKFMKRTLDILFSGSLLLLTLPLFPVIVFLVKYQSPGPLFYTQKRVGEGGKNFTIFKFRSMKVGAEQQTGVTWAVEQDPRISKFGAFLRKTRIDELPQLINVLTGKMSFIGPRPERPEFVDKICMATPYYMERHAVKPGITGWAQVMYPYGASIGDSIEKLRYDLYYINNLSLFLELLIVFETIKVILFRKGSR